MHQKVLIFLAGMEAFHTLSHLLISFTNIFPLHIFGITFTRELNIAAFAINALVTLGLLYWVAKTKK
ncbi:hypothetical protein HY489_04615 [Candidatus Woesearchaeota archaeon]|nr:hypothetical protein [Candidatus Woesearchaeota archaeon]